MWFDNFDELYFVSSIDTVAFIDGIEIILNEIFVLDQDDLEDIFEYNPEGDQFYIIDGDGNIVSYMEYDMYSFGNFPGAKVPVPDENQSLAIQKVVEIGYNEAFYYVGLEQSPTIGLNEFNINARGVLKGHVFDLNNAPIPDVTIVFPYYDPGSSYYPEYTDQNGIFVMDNLISANHWFNYYTSNGNYYDVFEATIYPYDTTYIEIQLDTLLQGSPEYHNFPNPFVEVTSFTIQIPHEISFNTGHLSIYNLAGKLVDQIEIPSNDYTAEWQSNNLEPGIYLYNIVLDKKQFATKKMIIL